MATTVAKAAATPHVTMSSPWGKLPPAAAAPPMSLASIQSAQQLTADAAFAMRLQEAEDAAWAPAALAKGNATDGLGEATGATGATEAAEAAAAAEAVDVAEASAAAGPLDPEVDSDLALALQLQAEFDLEHEAHVDEMERQANSSGSKVTTSFRHFRTGPARDSRRPREGYPSEEEEEEEGGEEEGLSYDRSARAYRDSEGIIITKHNAAAASKRHVERMEGMFPVGFASGDMRHKAKDVRLSNKVYNRLKSFADKGEKQRARLHEKKDHSTSVMALDDKTRVIMFKLVNGGHLQELNGVVSTGKESVVFHGVSVTDFGTEDPPVRVEVAVKVFKTTLTEFKERQQFLQGDRRFENRVGRQSARKLVKLWAEKEMSNLTRMHRAGIHCPRVVLNRKHVLIMTLIGREGRPAPKLKDVRMSPTKLRACYEMLKADLRTMYQECHLVHGDLSEYNVLQHEGRPWIIDVGQSVESTHPRAVEYMYRDCVNLVKFFTKGGVEGLSATDLMADLTGVNLSQEQELEYTHKISSGRAHLRALHPEDDLGDSSRVCVDFDPAAAMMAGVQLAPPNMAVEGGSSSSSSSSAAEGSASESERPNGEAETPTACATLATAD